MSGYDAWKTRAPDGDDGPVCAECGGFLLRDHSFLLTTWYCERCEAPKCSDIPIVEEREKGCHEPWHWDDGIPYCDVCGMFRATIARQPDERYESAWAQRQESRR